MGVVSVMATTPAYGDAFTKVCRFCTPPILSCVAWLCSWLVRPLGVVSAMSRHHLVCVLAFRSNRLSVI